MFSYSFRNEGAPPWTHFMSIIDRIQANMQFISVETFWTHSSHTAPSVYCTCVASCTIPLTQGCLCDHNTLLFPCSIALLSTPCSEILWLSNLSPDSFTTGDDYDHHGWSTWHMYPGVLCSFSGRSTAVRYVNPWLAHPSIEYPRNTSLQVGCWPCLGCVNCSIRDFLLVWTSSACSSMFIVALYECGAHLRHFSQNHPKYTFEHVTQYHYFAFLLCFWLLSVLIPTVWLWLPSRIADYMWKRAEQGVFVILRQGWTYFLINDEILPYT